MADWQNRRTAGEQAALRRVATLVARGVESEVVFAAVVEEVAALLDADAAAIVRNEPDGELTVMSGHGLAHFEPGARFKLDPSRAAVAPVWQPGHAVRYDADDPASTDLPEQVRSEKARSSVNAPILVEGHIWGMIGVGSRRRQLPPDTGQRLVSFTELVATAIADAQARLELRGFADEQVALRRVAVLVGRAAPPDEVFAAVTAEAGRVLTADIAILTRFAPDGIEAVVGVWVAAGAPPVAVGTRVPLGGRNVSSLVFQTGRSARIDSYADTSGAVGDIARSGQLPAGTEARLAGFTELAATAIASAHEVARVRHGAGGPAPGGDAGGTRSAAPGGVRRGHRASRPAT